MPVLKKKKHPSAKKALPTDERVEKKPSKKEFAWHISKTVFWFGTGMVLGLLLLISSALFIFRLIYANRIYPGVFIDGVNVGGQPTSYVTTYFDNKNKTIQATTFTLVHEDTVATISAKDI